MIRVAAVAILAAALCPAAEHAVLDTGHRIKAQRHEKAGDLIRLYVDAGIIEIPASLVTGFEQEDDPAPVPEATATAPVETTAATSRLDATPVASKPGATPAAPPNPKQLLDQAAERYGLPREILHSVARVESAYRPDAISPKGAIGIMQLMPETAALLSANPYDPAENVDAGARHLRDLLDQYDGKASMALAAYNAGAAAVERYRGIPPYRETQNYVNKVLWNFHKMSATANSYTPSPK